VLLFGAQEVGERVTETVLLQSRSGERFFFCGFSTDSKDVEIEPAAEHRGALINRVRVHWKISSTGNQQTTLRFNVKTAAGLTITVPVNASAFGLTNRLAVPGNGGISQK
jgi:hypothetical protein